MKKLILVMMAILIIPTVLALEECHRETSTANIPCQIISTWQGSTGNCTDSNATVYNSTPANISIMEWADYEPFCQAVFNITEIGTYQYNSSIEDGVITVSADLTFGGSILFFFFIINLMLFALPFVVTFVQSPIWNKLMGKAMWVLGLMFLALNTTLASELATKAGLGVSSIIFTYHWFFVRGIYIASLVLLVQTLLSSLAEWNNQNKEKRMGGM